MSEYSYCETIAATGPWHIRRLTAAGRKPTGGADTPTLCELKAVWDVPSRDVPFVFRRHEPGGHPPGNTCKACSDAFQAAPQGGPQQGEP